MKSKLMLLRLASVLALSAAIMFSSCKKDNQSNDPVLDDDLNVAVETAQNNSVASNQFDDVLNITQSVSSEDAGEDIGLGTESALMAKTSPINPISRGGSRCFTVNVIPKIRGEWPKTVTINFGDGCKGKDGQVRKGKIVSIYTKPAFMPGAVVSTTFLGYQVDSFAITGTHKVTNTSADRKISFKIEVINGKITNTNSDFWRKHEAESEFTQLDGWNSDINPLKNGYKITGTSKGSNSNGRSYKTQTDSPLIRKFDCMWIAKGNLKIWWNDNQGPANLDFGNGSCDDQAVLTYKGKSKTVPLK